MEDKHIDGKNNKSFRPSELPPNILSIAEVADLYMTSRSEIAALAGYTCLRGGGYEQTNASPTVARLKVFSWDKSMNAKYPTPRFYIKDVQAALGPFPIREEDIIAWREFRKSVRDKGARIRFLEKLAGKNGVQIIEKEYYIPARLKQVLSPNTHVPFDVLPELIGREKAAEVFQKLKTSDVQPSRNGCIFLGILEQVVGPVNHNLIRLRKYRGAVPGQFRRQDRNDYLTARQVWLIYAKNPPENLNPCNASVLSYLVKDVQAAMGPLPFHESRVAEWKTRTNSKTTRATREITAQMAAESDPFELGEEK